MKEYVRRGAAQCMGRWIAAIRTKWSSRIVALSFLGSIASFAVADAHHPLIWQVSNESVMGLTSTKNDIVSERHTLNAINGGIDGKGQLSLALDLSQIETNIPIRNERMQSWLFSAAPEALVTAQIEQGVLSSTQSGTVEQAVTVVANQQSVELRLPVEVTRSSPNEVRVAGQLMLDVAELGFAPGIEKLREIAGLKVISTRVPIDFELVFTRVPSSR